MVLVFRFSRSVTFALTLLAVLLLSACQVTMLENDVANVASNYCEIQEEKTMSMRSVIEELINQGMNEGNLEVVDNTITSDMVHTLVGAPDMHGPEGIRQYITLLRTAYPDLHQKIEEIICEGDTAVVRLLLTATHQGDLRGLAPTGNKINMPSVVIFRFRDGKIVSVWTILDRLEYMQQLGVIPRES